jgi:hypothetical protein
LIVRYESAQQAGRNIRLDRLAKCLKVVSVPEAGDVRWALQTEG